MDPEEKRKQLESDVLKTMEERLSRGLMDAERAQSIARMLLAKLHPPLSLDQLYQVVPTLDDEFKELSDAVYPLLNEHDEIIRDKVSQHAEALIKSGKFDEAGKVLESALN